MRWCLRPHEESIPVEASDPQYMILDSVFSLSMPVSQALGDLARQTSLEIDIPGPSSGPPIVTVPWIIVEYVKFYSGGSAEALAIHEAHLTSAFEVGLGMYKALGIDGPIFGILVDEMDISIYTAALVSEEVSTALPWESYPDCEKYPDPHLGVRYYRLTKASLRFTYFGYNLCQILDRVVTYSNTLRRTLEERLHQLQEAPVSA
jgi:hypothetical protein